MATYTVSFYAFDPAGFIPTGTGSSFTYTGPANRNGTATIFDPETGIQGITLDDDNAGGESATANVTVGGATSTGANVDAEAVWTVLDLSTGQTFEIAQFEVESGGAAGMYTLSEQPLIPGHSYQILNYDSNPNVAAGDPAFSSADYVDPDGVTSGTIGADLIDGSYYDTDGDHLDDPFSASGSLDDSIEAGAGNDTVYAGEGGDTVLGEGGADLIFGDSTSGGAAATPGSEFLSWSSQGADGEDVSTGFTQVTGDMSVNVSFLNTDLTNGVEIESTSTFYTDTGEPFDNQSSVLLQGGGPGITSTSVFQFSSAANGISNEVENVSFRILDIDNGGWLDIVTINAYDADGNPVAVTISLDGVGDSVSGNTITAGGGNDGIADADGAALITIAGPVSWFEIVYENGGNAGQLLLTSDIHFDTVAVDSSSSNMNDSLDGGAGDDTIFGEAGEDTLIGGLGADSLDGGDGDDLFYLAQGDIASGGDGDDTFIITDLSEIGSGAITVDGGTGATDNDTLDLNGLADRSTLTFSPSAGDPGAFDGSVTLLDGSVVTFTNIENIICFTPGTLIDTPDGPRAVETLRPGDMVMTLDDGPQPLAWTGNSTVPGLGKHAPIRIEPSLLPGATAPLTVSPQHRILINDWRAELLCGEQEVFVSAKQMLGLEGVSAVPMAEVSYIHLLFDRHQIITSNGAATESLHAAEQSLAALCPEARDELFGLMPELRDNIAAHGPTARTCLKSWEARLLLSRLFPAAAAEVALAA